MTDRPRVTKQWNVPTMVRAVEMYKAGWSSGFIYKQLGVPESTLRGWIERHEAMEELTHWTTHGRGKPYINGYEHRTTKDYRGSWHRVPREKKDYIVRLYVAEKKNTQEIAQIIGVHQTTVSYIVRKEGVARSRTEVLKLAYAKNKRKAPMHYLADKKAA